MICITRIDGTCIHIKILLAETHEILYARTKIHIDIFHLRCNIWHFKMVLICALQNHNYFAATNATAIEDVVDVEKRFEYVHTYIFLVHPLFFPFPFYLLPRSLLLSEITFLFILLLCSNYIDSNFTNITCLTNEKIERERLNLMCSYCVECFCVKLLCSFTMFLPFKVCFLY